MIIAIRTSESGREEEARSRKIASALSSESSAILPKDDADHEGRARPVVALQEIGEPAEEEDEHEVLPRVLAEVAAEDGEDENDGNHQAGLHIGKLLIQGAAAIRIATHMRLATESDQISDQTTSRRSVSSCGPG